MNAQNNGLTRISFLLPLILPPLLTAQPIDRHALVRRHNPQVRQYDPLVPLSVGNGGFAFTADVTGLQSFPQAYLNGVPLSTESDWGWDSFPEANTVSLKDALQSYDTYGRAVPYATLQSSDAGNILRQNPHRLGLGQLGLAIQKTDNTPAAIEDIINIRQQLDLWNGRITSHFNVQGDSSVVQTTCHPDLDLAAVNVRSALFLEGRLQVTLKFAYASDQFGKAPEDWTQPDRHQTKVLKQEGPLLDLERQLDEDHYYVRLVGSTGATIQAIDQHSFTMVPGPGQESLDVVLAFSPTPFTEDLPTVEQTQTASSQHWQQFWSTGGAIDLSASKDPRADELERRIVLSQYLTAIQCAGSMPPQETGLTCNSWYGKSHLEMHWWQGVHFALWDRIELLEKSLPWYDQIMGQALGTAQMQGYAGVRWPKMVGPEGRESPSEVGPLLIWQQPHPIYYAELCYRAHPNPQVLDQYKDIVFATAEFMASYAHWLEGEQRYVLGPPLIPAQECFNARTTMNPPFELEYWDWGLRMAQKWRERLGLPHRTKWDHVIEHLADLPQRDGVYLMDETHWITRDHPTVLAALGMLPGHKVDPATMRRTLNKVLKTWDWDSTWGWDYPMIAMTAARLGEPGIAVDILLKDVTKNTYLLNGHNYQSSRLPLYLPGNGGLLTAVAMMAAGWDGAPDKPAPGFPGNGQWVVKWEHLKPMP